MHILPLQGHGSIFIFFKKDKEAPNQTVKNGCEETTYSKIEA
jgi:hypothetical protein